MKKTYIIFASVFCFALFSCNNNSTQTKSQEEELTEEHASDHHHHHHEMDGDSEEIQLINGEKWSINEEMKPHILNGETLVNEFIENAGTDFSKLAENLKNENQNLVQSCTMKGQSHDELHKWLHPHLDLVKDLSTTEDEGEATNLVNQIQASYKEFHKYFQ